MFSHPLLNSFHRRAQRNEHSTHRVMQESQPNIEKTK